MVRSRKIPFFLENATVVATTAQGGNKKKCISLPQVSFSCHREA